MRHPVEEITELLERGDDIYKKQESCREHAWMETYDLIVLTAEAFEIDEVLKII